MSVEEELKILEHKMNQLRLDYEQYFLGTRPREPILLRGEVQKLIVFYSNTPIQNTAMRFKFASLCSRFQAFKRRWEETLRKMEDGSYSRHRFKARLHERHAHPEPVPVSASSKGDDIYSAYVKARRECGQDVAKLTPDRLDAILKRERASLRQRYGDAEFRFRVVVENGKAKLKASRKRSAAST
jgi:hypothetical protein